MFDQREPCAVTYSNEAMADLKKRLSKLRTSVKAELKKQGFKDGNIILESYLNLRLVPVSVLLLTHMTQVQRHRQRPHDDAAGRGRLGLGQSV
jgi:hypothetical protein